MAYSVAYATGHGEGLEESLSYVEVLRDKRQAVVSEIEALRAEAAVIAGRIAVKEGQLHNLEDLLALEGASAAPSPSRLDGSAGQVRSQRFVDAAFEMLEAAGKPLYYRDIAKQLAADGVYVPGQDPAANLIAHMSRDARFARAAERGVYGLAGWPTIKAAVAARRPAVARPRSSARVRRARANHGA